MTVTITDEALRLAVRVGDAPDEIAELSRLKAVAAERVTRYAPDAPDVIHDQAVVQYVGDLYDRPMASRFTAFAASFRNSGAMALLSDYRDVAASIIGDDDVVDDTPDTPTGGGFAPTLAGMAMLDARAQVAVWLDTGVQAPDTAFLGVQVSGVRATDGIAIFPNELIGDTPVVMGASATATLGMRDFALGVLASGNVAFAVQEAGQYGVAIYSLGSA